jgi:putative restriction endonuclease
MTVGQFLDWESRQEARYEFDRFAPVAMTGGTREHSLIQINLATALRARLQGGPCRVVGTDLRISVAGSIRLPGRFRVLLGFAGRYARRDGAGHGVRILSPETSTINRIDKNR